MKLRFHTLDVFTDEPFAGNGLAVVLEADTLCDRQMQLIAREFNLSETIFVQSPDDRAHTAKVRIFTPRSELPFAGHPTIGCAVLLASLKHKTGCSFETEIVLEEKAGLVPVKVWRTGGVPRAMFTAPVLPRIKGNAPARHSVAEGLGIKPAEIGFGAHNPSVIDAGVPYLLVPVAGTDSLARAKVIEPHWSAMLREAGTSSAYIYTAGGASTDSSYRARLYAPTDGIPEDPATGSAAATMPGQIHLCENLANGLHRWKIEQGYEMGRPSQIIVEADAKGGKITAVRVGGQAVELSRGELEF
jgi:trans-2,3-dihydro-3-hydroxyanthranilate isomerase